MYMYMHMHMYMYMYLYLCLCVCVGAQHPARNDVSMTACAELAHVAYSSSTRERNFYAHT
jgi:hypothetical protein